MQEVQARNDLIAAQESLLNVYRCYFNVDAQIVPGGCNRLAVVVDLGIWTMGGDRGDARKVVTAGEFEVPGFTSLMSNPVWSPDGAHIAYSPGGATRVT